jgi:hypothetical protein
MQYDMHYYAIYTLASAAGIPRPDAETIALASQSVDDQCIEDFRQLPTGEAVYGIATAHHPLNAGERVLSHIHDDSRLVWLPFHFFPGNTGSTFSERLITRKNSPLINHLLDFYISPQSIDANKPYILELLGIALHVYADTFSHYGFSGIAAADNRVTPNSIVLDTESLHPSIIAYLQHKAQELSANLANIGRLGHGGVLTYPDLPYLRWSYEDAHQVRIARDNPADYLDACAYLYDRLVDFAKLYYLDAYPPTAPWRTLKASIQLLIQTPGTGDMREENWLDAIAKNEIPGVTEVPSRYSSARWQEDFNTWVNEKELQTLRESTQYKFICAAYYHRDFVLKNFLPARGLVIA